MEIMRQDECYVKRSLEQYLSKFSENIKIIEGEDPPDFYVLYNGKKILLEVTRADPIFVDEKGVGNRNTSDISLIRLCNKLNVELGSKIDSQKTLCLSINGPINNFSKFKKSLNQKIWSIVNDRNQLENLYNVPVNINIENESIQINIIDSTPENKRICGFIGVASSKNVFNICRQASLILDQRIAEKEKKMEYINGLKWLGEKWLAILNDYFLASSETYIRAIEENKTPHTFSKILLVEEECRVTEIFNSSF